MDSKDNNSVHSVGFDECDRLSELHGASAVKSPTILSPALTDGDSSSQKTFTEKQHAESSRPTDEADTGQAREKEADPADTTEALAEKHRAADGEQTEAVANEQLQPPQIQPQQQQTKIEDITLKQLYGMLCWLQVGNNRRRWLEKPLDACIMAATECPHLINANPNKLTAKLDELNMARLQIIEKYGGAHKVPQDIRMFEGGPLFVIFQHALTEAPEGSHDAQTRSQLMANATGLKQAACEQPAEPATNMFRDPISQFGKSSSESTLPGSGSRSGSGLNPGSFRNVLENPAFGGLGAGGPIRHQKRTGTMMPNEHPFMQRARRLTPAEVRQMKEELAIRREIGIRDAVLLADWIALRRRELELKEAQIREIVRGAKDGTVENMVRFEEFMRKMYEEM
ncbi:hypothetical protein H4R99_001204 [Coemansia sp. RSA 1722]|nr:hypothetical protein LPJ57_000516 [Coemansia sp. RSA 486]KAJ2237246.1 hypothetical protein IWW45_001121 [Coemansia sp. RSA 485]KAJ2601411.1 hypothetical protein GGF39_001258 [Coemansia sp. RSA 1721]KAJ2605345.1 hypothetical protein H4R99_001204 [Coemansia sp. RSA 1722]KAJ2638790.1 hypothetical protein GGF40_001388 [Coemansia sp. RSA 1286]